MIAIVDYGVGNLFSLLSSLQFIGVEAIVTNKREEIEKADRIILPGVGAFGDAAIKLKESGLAKVIKNEVKKGKPLLGICLGMQLLFEKSYEYGEHEGLGLIEGEVVPFKGVIAENLKIPHIGWNGLNIKRESDLLKDTNEGDHVYYVHSYYCKCPKEYVLASSEYDVEVTGMVNKDNVFGCQFHPEKSGDVGLKILRNFAKVGESL